ncbi:unnamed protein product, partial [Onchocerca flexuosa]|uniref:Secreted protein n=1 Tax=Onchocerca flexuosa TaxID=387005 RepID=A0A183I6Y8_9BILA
PVVVIFTIFACLIHKNRFIHSINRVGSKAFDLQKFLNENNPAANIPNATAVERNLFCTLMLRIGPVVSFHLFNSSRENRGKSGRPLLYKLQSNRRLYFLCQYLVGLCMDPFPQMENYYRYHVQYQTV